MASGPKSSADRDQTDHSLRQERTKADHALAERQAAAHEDADEVVQLARDNADAILATARDKADGRLANETGAVGSASIAADRMAEDHELRTERAAADATLAREREETLRALARLIPVEREKTDRFLLTERGRSDTAIAQRDDFLGIVSHDLRNLLGGIVLSAAILSDDSKNGEEVRLAAAHIEHYAARMNRLIGDLVDVASLDAGVLAMTRAPGDARKLVDDALELFRPAAAAKQITFDLEVIGHELPGDFDYERLLQVFANLLSNAIKFAGPESTITVRAARNENGGRRSREQPDRR